MHYGLCEDAEWQAPEVVIICFFCFFFFEDVPLRTLHMLGNPKPNPLLNLRLLV